MITSPTLMKTLAPTIRFLSYMLREVIRHQALCHTALLVAMRMLHLPLSLHRKVRDFACELFVSYKSPIVQIFETITYLLNGMMAKHFGIDRSHIVVVRLDFAWKSTVPILQKYQQMLFLNVQNASLCLAWSHFIFQGYQ